MVLVANETASISFMCCRRGIAIARDVIAFVVIELGCFSPVVVCTRWRNLRLIRCHSLSSRRSLEWLRYESERYIVCVLNIHCRLGKLRPLKACCAAISFTTFQPLKVGLHYSSVAPSMC